MTKKLVQVNLIYLDDKKMKDNLQKQYLVIPLHQKR